MNRAKPTKTRQYNYVTCYSFDELNFFLAEYATDLRVDLDVAKQIVADRLEFTQHEEHYLVIDLSNVKEVTPEAKDFLQHPNGGLYKIKAAALFANNPVGTLLAQVYAKTPTTFPCQFFTSREDAIRWIQEFDQSTS